MKSSISQGQAKSGKASRMPGEGPGETTAGGEGPKTHTHRLPPQKPTPHPTSSQSWGSKLQPHFPRPLACAVGSTENLSICCASGSRGQSTGLGITTTTTTISYITTTTTTTTTISSITTTTTISSFQSTPSLPPPPSLSTPQSPPSAPIISHFHSPHLPPSSPHPPTTFTITVV
jgi:hypothetical protein